MPRKTSFTHTRAENTSARVCGMFYKAIVQSVLLFGSEAWVLLPATLQRLEGFHAKTARRMAGMLPKKVIVLWKFPKTKTVLAAAGLHTIEPSYMQVRRAHIMRWVIDWPILKLCRLAERRGTTPNIYW